MVHSSHFRLPLAVGLASLLLSTGPLAAADLDSGYSEMPQQQMVTFGSGWYIRGDIAATRGADIVAGDMPYQGIYLGPGQQVPSFVVSKTNDLSYDASIGGGYQFNQWFRADITGDYLQPVRSSYLGQGHPCITGMQGLGATPYQAEQPVTTICTPQLSSSLESYAGLVNGYIDLGTYWIVTPYVGAGAGMSFGHASASADYIQSNNVAYHVTYKDAINNSSYHQNWDRSITTNYYNFAYAIMAGLSFDVYQHTKFDINYRFLNLGNMLGAQVKMQQVRAGVRYMLDN